MALTNVFRVIDGSGRARRRHGLTAIDRADLTPPLVHFVCFLLWLYVYEEASCREASFVNCDGQFTSTSRTLSIAIASLKTTGPDRPRATNGTSMPLALIRRAVNPHVRRRPSRDRASVTAAPPHARTTAVSPRSMVRRRHATCRRRMRATARTLGRLAHPRPSSHAGRSGGREWPEICPPQSPGPLLWPHL